MTEETRPACPLCGTIPLLATIEHYTTIENVDHLRLMLDCQECGARRETRFPVRGANLHEEVSPRLFAMAAEWADEVKRPVNAQRPDPLHRKRRWIDL